MTASLPAAPPRLPRPPRPPQPGPPRRKPRPWLAALTHPVTLSVTIAVIAFVLIAVILWPTWHSELQGNGPDRLPITVGGTLFNVPANAIRINVQRRPGAQERIDLAFTYPGLTAPEKPTPVTAETVEQTPVTVDRLFVTLQAHNGALAPDERLQTIYPRYLDAASAHAADGLTVTAFREGTPYRQEDLLTAAAPASFAARCSRDAATPGMCLSERRIDGADLMFRFPRAWIADWRTLAGNLDELTRRIATPSGR